MKVNFTEFSPNIPNKKLYERGIDYLSHEFDLEVEDVLYLLKKLKNNRSHLWIETTSASLDFTIEEDNSLSVEIYDYEEFWGVAEIDLEIGEEILRQACEGEKFGNLIPKTDREWGAYSGI